MLFCLGFILNKYLSELRKKSMSLPLLPGVYIMKNRQGKIIYIGKAKKLKNRVSQYFGSQNTHSEKVKAMVENVFAFDYIVVDSEFEALILECSLIKQNMPKYNILLKDSKGYSFIKKTNEEYPKIISVYNNQDKNASYLGPFISSHTVRESVETANTVFKLPTCTRVFPRDIGKERPCLYYYINKCSGVCSGKVSKEIYVEAVSSAWEFLNGDTAAAISKIKEKMEEASENLDFETAAKLRDRIFAIEAIMQKQKVIYENVKEQDVFAAAEYNGKICLSVLRFSGGRLIDTENFFFENEDNSNEFRKSYLESYYNLRDNVPKRILLDGEVEDKELLEKWLSEKKGRKVEIFLSKRGEQLKILDMARENAEEKLAIKVGYTGKKLKILEELKRTLRLDKVPEYIESYDISHTGGENSVGGMVVFEGGRPLKRAYRKFKIKSFTGNDDYRSMIEVISRRFNEYKKASDKGIVDGFGRLPDLILLDGGLGQVRAVEPLIKSLGLNVAIFGMVKDEKHRTRAIQSTGGEITISDKKGLFKFITEIQDEVHRYAIGYHRKLRTKNTLNMSLTEIDGIGEKRAMLLLKHFKSIAAVKNAELSELERVKGMTKTAALNLYNYYHG